MKISNKLYNNGCNNADAVFNHSLNGRYPMRIGKFQPPPPQKINTPEPIDKKFGTIDYVREGTSYAKFGRNPSTGGFWANG